MEVQLGNIGQLLRIIDCLDNRQKRALQAIIYSMDYSGTKLSMPSWIHGTRQQWLDYLNSQKKHAIQITSRANFWLMKLKPYLSVDSHSLINLGMIIDQDPDLKRFKQQNPLLTVLLASRITSDRDHTVRSFYHKLIIAFANLADPYSKSFDRARDLTVIYHNVAYLSRHFTLTDIKPQITKRVIDDLRRGLLRLHLLAEIPGSNPMAASLIAHHTYAELNQLARIVSLSFRHTATAHQFVRLFLEQLNHLKSSRFKLEKHLLPRLAKDPAFRRTYQSARRHPQLVLNLLSGLANLNVDNRLTWIKGIAGTIKRTPELRSLSAAQNIVSYAASTVNQASSASASNVAAGLFHKMINQDNNDRGTVLFTALVNRLTGERDASHGRRIIRFVKNNLKSSRTLPRFLERLSDRMGELHGRVTNLLKYYVMLMIRFNDNYELNAAYQLLRQHISVVEDVLDKLASLTRCNQIANLNQVAEVIDHSSLSSLGAFRIVQSNAASVALQADARRQSYLSARSDASNANEIFSSLLNSSAYTTPLFNTLVSRLTIPHVPQIWREELALVEYDFNNSPSFGSFIYRLSRLTDNRHGRIIDVLRYFIQLMRKFSDNPQLNRTYQILRKHRQIVMKIMESIRTLDTDNQYYNLSQIAKVVNASELGSVSAVSFLASAASQQVPDSFREAVASRSTAQQRKAQLLSKALRERSQLSRALSINSRISSSSAAASVAQAYHPRLVSESLSGDASLHGSSESVAISSGDYSAARSASSGQAGKDNSSATSSSVRDLLVNMNQWLDALNSQMSKK